MPYTVSLVDYNDHQQTNDLLLLLNEYAQSPMGGGKPLTRYTQKHLISALAKHPSAFSVIAYDKQQAIGLANCFEGFSTFQCRPLINIHDFMVSTNYRGQGISQQLLDAIESIAKARHCCKITLEVLSGNASAQRAYEKYGFTAYELDPHAGHALFWEKTVTG